MQGVRILKGLGALAALAGLAACASVVGSTESAVQIRTNPDKARCELRGHEGYTASVETPATVTIPTNAAPVTVTCQAAGFRPTSYTLDATTDGWIWGNSALFVATGGIAVLGALVDESRSAGKSYAEEVHYTLPPDAPRAIRVRSRAGDVDTTLQAR
jgi:hypothetical protein